MRTVGRAASGWILAVAAIALATYASASVSPAAWRTAIAFLAGADEASASPIRLRLAIAAYTAACAVFLPTPSEAVILLRGRVSLFDILVAAAIGKALGSLVLGQAAISIAGWIDRSRFASLVAISDRRRAQLTRWGLPAYFVMQSVPFLPMRSSIYAYAHISRSLPRVVVGAGVGTLVRTTLMLGMLSTLNVMTT
jgi:hypothetical protein